MFIYTPTSSKENGQHIQPLLSSRLKLFSRHSRSFQRSLQSRSRNHDLTDVKTEKHFCLDNLKALLKVAILTEKIANISVIFAD